jgi:hypothetical protein
LYPCRTPIEALEILLGPGVKLAISTKETKGKRLAAIMLAFLIEI